MAWNMERRWGAGARLDGGNARDRLLDIAADCYLTYGVERTSIADVARTAGLSRQAVHGYCGSAAMMRTAVLRRSLGRLWSAMEEETGVAPSYSNWLVSGLLYAATQGRELPPARLLFLSDVAAPLRDLLLTDREYLYERSDALAGIYEAAYRRRDPSAASPDPLAVVEWFHRQFLSYQTRSPFFDQQTIRATLLRSCPGNPPAV